MRNILIFFVLVGLTLGFSNMAYAKRVFLYKDINDKNPGYDQLYGYRVKSKMNPAISVNFSLPTEHKENGDDLWLDFSVGIPPSSGESSIFMLKIDRIRIRSEKENYAIYLQESAQRRYGNQISFSDGGIFGQAPFEFGVGNTFGATFGVKINPPYPETLYLDYKLYLTSAAGEKDLLEETITMEKKSYKTKPKNPFFR